jgi:hypothetical protein
MMVNVRGEELAVTKKAASDKIEIGDIGRPQIRIHNALARVRPHPMDADLMAGQIQGAGPEDLGWYGNGTRGVRPPRRPPGPRDRYGPFTSNR